MASVPKFDTHLIRFWQQVCDIAANYGEVLPIDTTVKARDKLINVLWDTQRDELLTMVVGAQAAADIVIDAVRGATPRPTLLTPVAVGDDPIYPLEFDVVPSYSAVTNFSYTREDFNPPATPPGPLPTWWYIGEGLYRMVLRSTDYLTTPLEPVSGVSLGVWGASMWYGIISLQLLNNGYATAKSSAQAASIQIVSILNEKSRRTR
jgi:hypothetical protein